MKKNDEISLIVPVFNDYKRLKKSIDEIILFLKQFKKKELIIVNDGKDDKTLNLLKRYKKKNNFIEIISYEKNRGKGYAVKMGILKAKFKQILISDCDLSTPLNEFFNLKKYAKNNDIVIASRALKTSNVEKYQNIIKKTIGEMVNLIIRAVLFLNIKDTQCGFKLFKPNIKSIFEKAKIERFGWDPEILFLAKKNNFKIKEVGVKWINDEKTTVKLIDYFRVFRDVLLIRINYILGNYKK